MSPNNMQQKGPAITCEMSSTRMPASGKAALSFLTDVFTALFTSKANIGACGRR